MAIFNSYVKLPEGTLHKSDKAVRLHDFESSSRLYMGDLKNREVRSPLWVMSTGLALPRFVDCCRSPLLVDETTFFLMSKLQCLVGKHHFFDWWYSFFLFVFIDWWYHDIQPESFCRDVQKSSSQIKAINDNLKYSASLTYTGNPNYWVMF